MNRLKLPAQILFVVATIVAGVLLVADALRYPA
jgi:hypothetical protein